jgi:hypothetical protein
MLGNRLCGELRGGPVRVADIRGKRARVRIEPEADLTAPLLDGSGEPVGKRSRQRISPGVGLSRP